MSSSEVEESAPDKADAVKGGEPDDSKSDTKKEEKKKKKESKGGDKKEKEPDKKTPPKGPPPPPPEYNPRWKGYTLIAFTSLVNFSAIATISRYSPWTSGHPAAGISFGIATFLICFVIIAADRSQCFAEKFNYSKAMDGKFEGYTLIFLCVYWIVGVGYMTQVAGLGYLTLNIYFGAWATLISCCYTLNEWSKAKDILSFDELTGVSATLKSWYLLFISALVIFGTSLNFLVFVDYGFRQLNGAALGAAAGAVSALSALFWICIHYNFFLEGSVEQGGWMELSSCCAQILLWIVTAAIITSDGGVGASIVGADCPGTLYELTEGLTVQNCTIEIRYIPGTTNITLDPSIFNLTNSTGNSTVGNQTIVLPYGTASYPCSNVIDTYSNPGSNLYVFSWLALASSVNLAFRWKAQQALQFAQAQNTRRLDDATNPGRSKTNGAGESEMFAEDDFDDEDYIADDDDDDLDDFEDAAY